MSQNVCKGLSVPILSVIMVQYLAGFWILLEQTVIFILKIDQNKQYVIVILDNFGMLQIINKYRYHYAEGGIIIIVCSSPLPTICATSVLQLSQNWVSACAELPPPLSSKKGHSPVWLLNRGSTVVFNKYKFKSPACTPTRLSLAIKKILQYPIILWAYNWLLSKCMNGLDELDLQSACVIIAHIS